MMVSLVKLLPLFCVVSIFAAPFLRALDPAESTKDPETAARVFYTELRRLGVSGLPDESAWAALKGFCSESLRTALDVAVKEQAEFMRKFPDEKPPWIEGDLFSSLFEGPRQYQVGKPRIQGEMAEVPVECAYTEGGETTKWTDMLILSKSGDSWLIDDVSYGGDWDFANSGTLKDALAPEEEEDE